MINKKKILISATIAFVSYSSMAWAQQQPDAGRLMQEMKSAPSMPSEKTLPDFKAPKSTKKVKSGGAKVKVSKINFTGNEVFTDEELNTVLEGALGKKYDLAGLRKLTDIITDFYRMNDYPFAHAIVPKQASKKGKLQIRVVEGQYGDIAVKGAEFVDEASAYLAPLTKGNVIKGSELERVSLILDDLPGYKFTPIVKPGKKVGSGDVSFVMRKDDKDYGASAVIDNHGNRYTGRERTRVDFYNGNNMTFGDKIDVNAVFTDENMWNGSVAYNVPLNNSGLRGEAKISRTNYELGAEFTSLGAYGTADIMEAKLSYPIIRAQKKNLTLSIGYMHKWMTDGETSSSSKARKNADIVPVTLSFDSRDDLMGGGVTYGTLGWTHGILDLDSGLTATDQTSANSRGHYDKINIDVSRLQATPIKGMNLFARLSAQKAFKNLDSSEDFGLGGPQAVRAYPAGEAYGDEGGLGQVELRFSVDKLTPYVFYDYGHIKTNEDPWAAGDNDRTIAGAGAGFRFDYDDWSLNASSAWRTIGGAVQSDARDNDPTIWADISYKF